MAAAQDLPQQQRGHTCWGQAGVVGFEDQITECAVAALPCYLTMLSAGYESIMAGGVWRNGIISQRGESCCLKSSRLLDLRF